MLVLVFGIVAAVSALRVRGVNLAIATIAAAVALEHFVFANSSWGGGVNGSPTPSPSLFGFDLGPGADYSWAGDCPRVLDATYQFDAAPHRAVV